MDLNCKVGDLAIGVSAVPEKQSNIGCVVRIMRPWPGMAGYWEVETLAWAKYEGVPHPPGLVCKAKDACMRPLRDSEGEDEMLRLVGRPVGEPQAA